MHVNVRNLIHPSAVDATHYFVSAPVWEGGGRTIVGFGWFKQVGENWYVFRTDSNGDYPGWLPVEKCFPTPFNPGKLSSLEKLFPNPIDRLKDSA